MASSKIECRSAAALKYTAKCVYNRGVKTISGTGNPSQRDMVLGCVRLKAPELEVRACQLQLSNELLRPKQPNVHVPFTLVPYRMQTAPLDDCQNSTSNKVESQTRPPVRA